MALDSMHPRIAEIIDVLEAAQLEMMNVLTAIPAPRRDAPAPEGKWSIAQHIEHLALVEDGTGRLISRLIKEADASGQRETEDSSLLHSLDAYGVTTAARRIEAPDMVQPKEGLSSAEALARQSAARTRMIEALRRASGSALATVSYPHPLVGQINGYQWGLITALHQRRHLAPMRELAGLGDA